MGESLSVNVNTGTAERKVRDWCPHCGTRYQLPDKELGKEARCGKCSKHFFIGGLPPFLREELTERFDPLLHLGAGGMGRVYRGIDRVLGQERAIKVISPPPGLKEEAIERVRERFKIEIRTLATLTEEPHANIVRFYFYGVRKGYFYYVMGYVEGPSYSRILKKQGSIPTDEVRRLGLGIGSALHHLHERGLIHRDVKPGNIVRREPAGDPILIDFGLAKDLDADELQQLTGERGGMGTLSYMPFEQKYHAKSVDHRADQYALAATMAHLVTGEVPDPPEWDHVRNADLRAVLEQAMQRDARKRFADMPAFLQALEAVRVKPQDDIAESSDVSEEDVTAWFNGDRNRRPMSPEFRARIEAEARRRAKIEVHRKHSSPDAPAEVSGEKTPPPEPANLAPAPAAGGGRAARDTADVNLNDDAGSVSDIVELDLNIPNTPAVSDQLPLGGQSDVNLPADPAPVVIEPPDRTPTAGMPRPGSSGQPPPRSRAQPRTPGGGLAAERERRGLRPRSAVRTQPRTPSSVHQHIPVAPARLDLPTPTLVRTLRGGNIVGKGHNEAIWAVDVSADGKTVITGSGDQTVKLWDATTGKIIGSVSERSPVSCVAFSIEGQAFAVGTSRTDVYLYAVNDRRKLATLSEHSWSLNALVFFRGPIAGTDSAVAQMVSAGGDGAAVLWDMSTRTPRKTLHIGPPVQSLALTPDGSRLLTGAEDGSMAIWDVTTGQLVGALQTRGLDREVRAVAIAPDGKRAVTACRDGLIRHWDIDTRQVCALSRGHDQPVRALVYVADGSLIASAGTDGTIRFWDADNGAERARIEDAHKGKVTALAAVRREPLLVSAGEDHVAHIWSIEALAR